MTTGRIQGLVKWYDRARREGFVMRHEGPDVHVPGDALADPEPGYLLEGQAVEFEIRAIPGGFRARDVRVVEPDPERLSGRRPTG